MRALIVVACLSITCSAPAKPKVAPPEPRDPTRVVEGIVIDEDDQPVAGATMLLWQESEHTDIVTDADGYFVFEDVAPRTYLLSGSRDDLVVAFGEIRVPGTGRYRLRARRAPTLTLHVVDQDGAPISGARVELRPREVTTDDRGQVVMRGAPGSGATVSAPGFATTWIGYEKVDADYQVDATVVLEPGATVTGLVIDDAGEPVEGVAVGASGTGHQGTKTDRDGRWELQLPAGRFAFQASHDDSGFGGAPPITCDGHSKLEAQTIQLRRGSASSGTVVSDSELHGQVVDSRGTPSWGARVYAQASTGWLSLVTDEEGRFDFGPVPRTEYALYAEAEGLSGGAAPYKRILAHSEGGDVRLVLPDPGVVAGRLRYGLSTVTSFVLHIYQGLSRVVASDGDQFRIQLPAGDRTLFFIVAGVPTKMARVAVEPGQTSDLGDITLEKGVTIRGRVIDEVGTPLTRATVAIGTIPFKSLDRAGNVRAHHLTRAATTDGDGRFVVHGVEDRDDLHVAAVHRTGRSEVIDAVLDGSEVSLVVRPTGAIEGLIHDADPTAGEMVIVESVVGYDVDGSGFTTRDSDWFVVDGLPPGQYRVKIYLGYATYEEIGIIEVRSGETTTIEHTMAMR